MNIKAYKKPSTAVAKIVLETCIFHGDCFDLLAAMPDNFVDVTFTSPPYCMGKDYESSRSVDDFINFHKKILPEIVRITKPGGSICWQVGYHSQNGQLVPLDCIVYGELSKNPEIFFRNRIVWSFAHGLHKRNTFSGRHETILWFTKGPDYSFDLDRVRVPQKYPGKRSYKGPNKGKLSGNPLGKNPGDIWDDIPNVKGHHVEKLDHPCQFPIALPQRFIRALCGENALVFDPFMGVGSTGAAALLENKRFLGAELQTNYVEIARKRLAEAQAGTVKIRQLGQPIQEPKLTDAVARKPSHFRGR